MSSPHQPAGRQQTTVGGLVFVCCSQFWLCFSQLTAHSVAVFFVCAACVVWVAVYSAVKPSTACAVCAVAEKGGGVDTCAGAVFLAPPQQDARLGRTQAAGPCWLVPLAILWVRR